MNVRWQQAKQQQEVPKVLEIQIRPNKVSYAFVEGYASLRLTTLIHTHAVSTQTDLTRAALIACTTVACMPETRTEND